MAYAWTITNALSALAAANFVWTSGPSDATRLFMVDRRMGKQFVCTAASSGNTLNIDMGAATSLKGFAFLNHNLASFGGTVTAQVQAATLSDYSNAADAKAITTLDFTQPHSKDFVLQFPAVSKRYWRIILTWTGTKTLKVGEVFAYATATALSRKDVYGPSGEGHEIRVASVESDNLEQRAYQLAGPRRSKRMTFSDLSTSERAELEALFFATKGPINPVLFVLSQNEVATAAAADDTDVMFAKLDLTDFSYSDPDFRLFTPPVLVLQNLAREVGA